MQAGRWIGPGRVAGSAAATADVTQSGATQDQLAASLGLQESVWTDQQGRQAAGVTAL